MSNSGVCVVDSLPRTEKDHLVRKVEETLETCVKFRGLCCPFVAWDCKRRNQKQQERDTHEAYVKFRCAGCRLFVRFSQISNLIKAICDMLETCAKFKFHYQDTASLENCCEMLDRAKPWLELGSAGDW